MRRILLVGLLVLAVAGCAARGALVATPPGAPVAAEETVFIGTTRGEDPVTGAPFGRTREPTPRYLSLTVAIPPDRQPGEIAWPSGPSHVDPAREFTVSAETDYDSDAAFRQALRAALLRRPPADREAVIFVHGFNKTFAEGVFRLAQFGHDLPLKGVLVHYAWPSRGSPLGYAYDRDSVLFARDGLEALLGEVRAAGADRILVVGHSLGAALTMETLRQMAIAGDGRVRARLSGVILVSPDLDVDVFRAQARRIGPLPQPFVIFTSSRDRALSLSARLAGEPDRLGNVTDVAQLGDLRVTLLDTSAFSTGMGHFNAGNSPALLAILGRLAEVDTAFRGEEQPRAGLLGATVLTVRNATEIVLSPVAAIAGAAN